MAIDQVENRQEYHDIIAQSMGQILSKVANGGEDKVVKNLAIFNMRQAYIIWSLDSDERRQRLNEQVGDNGDYFSVLAKELDDLNLESLTPSQLICRMFIYQTLAGIKPVQTYRRQARVFAAHRGELMR